MHTRKIVLGAAVLGTLMQKMSDSKTEVDHFVEIVVGCCIIIRDAIMRSWRKTNLLRTDVHRKGFMAAELPFPMSHHVGKKPIFVVARVGVEHPRPIFLQARDPGGDR